MQYQGVLKKMQTELASPVQYYLMMGDDFIHVNQLLGKKIHIEFVQYQCLACGKDKKIYRQGYCYDDFYKVPQAADWIMRPELSKAHLDIEDRDLAYERVCNYNRTLCIWQIQAILRWALPENNKYLPVGLIKEHMKLSKL